MPKLTISAGYFIYPEHPEYYTEGQEAKRSGIRLWDCPYKDLESLERRAWMAGWQDEEYSIVHDHHESQDTIEVMEDWYNHKFPKGEVMARAKAQPGKVRTREHLLRAYDYHKRLLKEVHPNTPKLAEYHQRRMGELFAQLKEQYDVQEIRENI